MNETFRMDTDEVKTISVSINSLKEDLLQEYTSLQNSKQSLSEHWNGDNGSVAAQGAIDDVLNLYRELITTVESTADSLNSAANGAVATDEGNASMFRNI